MKFIYTAFMLLQVLMINAFDTVSFDQSEELQRDNAIKSKLVTFFRLCDTNRNGHVTWTEFHTYRKTYSYKSLDDFSANEH